MLDEIGLETTQTIVYIGLFFLIIDLILFFSLIFGRLSEDTHHNTSSTPEKEIALHTLIPSLPKPRRYVKETVENQTWCDQCEHHRMVRTHHCRRCGVCIPRLDHHCVWIGKTYIYI